METCWFRSHCGSRILTVIKVEFTAVRQAGTFSAIPYDFLPLIEVLFQFAAFFSAQKSLCCPVYMRRLLAGMRRISHPPSNFTHDEASVPWSILFRGAGLMCPVESCLFAGIIYALKIGKGNNRPLVHSHMQNTIRMQLKEYFYLPFLR